MGKNPWNITPREAGALDSLAKHGYIERAADAYGMSYTTFCRRLSSARQRMGGAPLIPALCKWSAWRATNGGVPC